MKGKCFPLSSRTMMFKMVMPNRLSCLVASMKASGRNCFGTMILLCGFALPCLAIEVEFNRDIRPIVSNTCFQCHGPDANTREAGLRLDLAAEATADLGGYAAIVPGDAEASEALQRMLSDDPSLRMPPPDSGLVVTPSQIEVIRQWIEQGANYQQHWAFEPITRPVVPQVDGGTHAKGFRGPIDAFIQRRLSEQGIHPQGPAEPLIQLRRVSLDLTGLPPTLDEIDDFVKDVDQLGLEAAYEAAVDRLLGSHRFGEKMAWHWLEAARYADTDGYQNDGPREMWRWRDWVIDAYNRNMPFDQFTIEQLAGDLLPRPTHEQLIATAFNRNHRYNSEEGIPIDEYLLENAVDRVDTTSTVWLGMTFGCARCHDHKYDPISQVEYYQLIDYFNDVAESGRAVKFGNSEPWIKTPTDDQRQRLKKFDRRVASAEQTLQTSGQKIARAATEWFRDAALDQVVLQHGLDHHFRFDHEPDQDDRVTIVQGRPTFRDGRVGKAATFGGQEQLSVGKVPGLIGNGRFSIAFWVKPEDVQKGVVLSNEEPGTMRAGILVQFKDGHLRWDIIHRWISGVSTIETKRTFQPGQWVHITLTNDGTQRAQGMQLYVDGVLQDVNVVRNTNSNTAKPSQGAALSLGYSKHEGFWKGQLDELRIYPSRTLSDDEAKLLPRADTIAQLQSLPEEQRCQADRQVIELAYLESEHDPNHSRLLDSLRAAVAARTAYDDSLPTTMIMQDLPGGRPSFVRLRGVYDALGEQVNPGVPEVFPAAEQPADRLEFARWLVSSEHPLTARVAVNRYWQLLFGQGIVRSAEDFGSQGELPDHPQLLDYLASEFIASGWDTKYLLKTIVMSDTYRRSSEVTKDLLELDPANIYLARAPRLRLPGNVLRDQALFISELLVDQLGGPSVFPYQPAGLWREASNVTYKVGKGEDLYRRSLYTYWKRTLAPPTMTLLDAAEREWCSVRPRSTNTPLQALVLLNEPTFTEAAKRFARQIVAADESESRRIKRAFQTVATRLPSTEEQTLLEQAWQAYRNEFALHPELAREAATLGTEASESTTRQTLQGDAELEQLVDLAAATALANVLLNLDEVTSRE